MKNRIFIKNDLFNIANRIKSVDENYFILFNIKSEKFEVHNSMQKISTFCLLSPFEKLDCRLLNFVLKTRIENFDEINKEIDKNNLAIENELNRNRTEISKDKLKEIYDYSKLSKDFISENSFKNKWL